MAVNSVNGKTGDVILTPADVQAAPQASFRTLDHYGPVNGNNSTDNDATLQAVGSADGQIWVPGKGSETLYVSGGVPRVANKRWRGATKFRLGAGADAVRPVDTRFATVRPAAGAGTNYQNDMSGDLWFSDATWAVVGEPGDPNNVRRNLTEDYLAPELTPKFLRFETNSGGAGASAIVRAAPYSSGGQHFVPIDLSGAGAHGFAAGQTIGFRPTINNGALVQESGGPATRTVLGVTVGSPPANSLLQISAPAPAGVTTGSVVTHSIRTLQLAEYVELQHNGEGDAGALGIYVYGYHSPLAGQRHAFLNSTAGGLHFDVKAQAAGVSVNAMEGTFNDDYLGVARPSIVHGQIWNFKRTGRTSEVNEWWTGIQIKVGDDTTYPINNGLYLGGKMDVGLDLASGVFTNQRAMALGQSQRIYFDSAVNPAGAIIYPLWSNVVGNTYVSLESTSGVRRWQVSVDGVESLNVRNGVVTATGSMVCSSSLSVGTNISANGNLNLGGYVSAAGNITSTGGTVSGAAGTFSGALSAGGNLTTSGHLGINRTKAIYLDGIGSATYIAFDGSTIYLLKNGSIVASW